ncbi:MAG: peptide chain release factor N(5)-glutamine methyltransferase [Alphaproteobacteria bacterium]|nr:peptide chain release factor N(5)-glutamine methyltransferase [Alphaproteobacteria bacterium]MDE2112364.1 peptide chain release factor N(5)-glutamine methyltransferase [Alphaproteobacteria bacterium]MDE2492786.1 peptide chain release factor N(5)-glutamine methyltransferase [Alphaproteobacteria bacterium]
MSDSLLTDTARRLAAVGVDNPRLDARLLWAHARGDGVVFESFVSRREAREPLAYITGRKEFWSLEFEVGPGVLIPRPETETIIETALAAFPDRTVPLNVLDFGTGTACLLVAFLKEFINSRGLGIEKSEKARGYAIRNIAKHDLGSRCAICAGDWADAADGPYDVVLSNPPYIRASDIAGLQSEVSRFEPRQALDGGADGLSAYRALAPEIARRLCPKGRFFVEIGTGQSDEVADILGGAGLEIAKVVGDLAGIPRVLAGGLRW